MGKIIELTKGWCAWVDDADYDWLMQWSWCLSGNYAVRGARHANGQHYTVLMHRALCERWHGPIPPDKLVDHADQDTLNNTEANLRIVDKSLNNANRPTRARSGYHGVFPNGKKGHWMAMIRDHGKAVYLGTFDDPAEAGEAYKKAYLKLHGQPFAPK